MISKPRAPTATSSSLILSLALAAAVALSVHGQTPAKHPIVGEAFVANLYIPACQGKCPVVLLAGGSGGGIDWQDYMGDVLARNGFAAVAVGYFAMVRLPKELDQLPLEYFQRVLAYVHSHPSLNPERVGIAGNSKGAELALLLASHDAAIRAVVAFVPSSVVWQSLPSSVAWDRAAEHAPRHSSWTFKGEPLAFVPYVAATSSESLADMIVERLREHAFAFPYEHIAYDDAGHMIHTRGAANLKGVPATRRGGTARGNRIAQDDAERRMLEFFRRHLGSAIDRK